MLALISLTAILIISNLVTRIATVALTLTGISEDIAKFQALSAITGAGFTTSESEDIINHPLRRQIIAITIRLGGIGFLTTIASLLLTFVNTASDQERIIRLVILGVLLVILGLLSQSVWLDNFLKKIITYFLQRWSGWQIYDYAGMLNLTRGYLVDSVPVKQNSWVAGKTLAQAQLQQEGVLVLGIYRADGSYLGAPKGRTVINAEDTLIAYGKSEVLQEIEDRIVGNLGDVEHRDAVSEHLLREDEEASKDRQISS